MVTFKEILEWSLTGEQIKQRKQCRCDGKNRDELSDQCCDRVETVQYNQ